MDAYGRLEPDLSTRAWMAIAWAASFSASLGLFLISVRPDPLVAAASIACGGLLLIVALHDERTFLIPDRLVALLCLAAVGFHLASDPQRLPELAAAAGLAFGLLWLIGAFYEALRGHPGLGL